jgi:hypothetical protein
MIFIRKNIRKAKYIIMGFFSRFTKREKSDIFIYEDKDR